MKYTNLNQWYQEYGKEVMDKNEFSEFEKYLDDERQNGSHTLDEWENLYDDFLKDSKKSVRKSIKESDDDNWYKLKVLNEMLDAMAKDEYNIPKVGIYGVTKNINLDEGAIRALIKYYK